MNPALATTVPPAPSCAVSAHNLTITATTPELFAYLKAFANVASVNCECDEDDPPENPQCARDRQLVKPGLDEPIALVSIDFCYADDISSDPCEV
jgi:hypothetical protein